MNLLSTFSFTVPKKAHFPQFKSIPLNCHLTHLYNTVFNALCTKQNAVSISCIDVKIKRCEWTDPLAQSEQQQSDVDLLYMLDTQSPVY